MIQFIKFIGIIVFFSFQWELKAHPVSFEGGYALMSEMNPINQEISFVYSPKWWMGTGLVFDRNEEQWRLTSLHFAILVKRWNRPEAQGNFYLFGGPGFSHLKWDSEREDYFYRMGVQADFETRRVYFLGRFVENRLFHGNKKLYNRLDTAVGFAPYLADFDELNSWVVLKVRTDNAEFHHPLTILILRFFYKNFLWEVGQDFKGNSHLNFMIRY